jgi:hypothetical protein
MKNMKLLGMTIVIMLWGIVAAKACIALCANGSCAQSGTDCQGGQQAYCYCDTNGNPVCGCQNAS